MDNKFLHTTNLNKRTSGFELVKNNAVSAELWAMAKAICETTVGMGALDAEIALYLPHARAAKLAQVHN